MWFTFVTARLFHSLSFQPRLAATLLSSCSVANSLIRRVGLSPTFQSASLAQHPKLSAIFDFFRVRFLMILPPMILPIPDTVFPPTVTAGSIGSH